MLKATIARRNRGPRYSAGELKYLDIASAGYVADTTGSVTCLNLTAVGDDNTNRDGRQIINKSIHIQGLLQPSDDSTSPNLSRMLIVWDSQPNGAIATITDILVASTSVSSTNLNNRERFRILKDLRLSQGKVDTTATSTFSNSDNTYCVNEFIKLNDLKTTYSGTTAVIASIATGALLMVTIGSVAAAAGGTFGVTTRLRFADA